MKKSALCRTVAAAALVMPSIAFAQAGPEQSAATTADTNPQSDSGGLQDIIVTAQKRSESLQEVPIAIVAISGEQLAANRVMTSQDLQFSVPSLIYNQLSAFAQPYLRGIGSDVTQPNADPSVATYVDGVFVSFNAGTVTNLLGVERVEVLQGPQGTLYGRNAVAGAINIYTLTPSQELDASATATYGNYDRKELSGYISGGVTDTLAIGLYLGGIKRDTYLHRVNPDTLNLPGEPKGESMYGGRIKAVWTPTDTLKFTGSAEVQRVISFEQGAFRNIQEDALAYTLGAPKLIRPYYISANVAQYNRIKTHAFMLREEWDMGWARLLGITGYRRLWNGASDDIDATTLDLLDTTTENYGAVSRQFSQELQIVSPDDSPFDWIAGVYYFNEKSGFQPNTAGGLAISGAVPGSADLLSFGLVRTRSYAAFAQATVPLTEGLKLTVGGRYTSDKKNFLGGIQRFVDEAGNPVLPDITFAPDNKTWKKFTPKIGLDYKIGDVLLYASYSKGFKSGVYNVAAPGDLGPVAPENLTDYEFGLKSELFDRKVRLNIAGFYYDYKDLQVQKVLNNAAGSTSLQNAASAKLYGAEVQLELALVRDLRIGGTVAWEHAEYKDFDNPASYIPNPGGNLPFPSPSSAAGNDLPRAPKWVFTAHADYKLRLADESSIDFGTKYYHNGGFWWESTNRFRQKSYGLLDASVAYNFPGDKITVRAFGSNITNKYYSSTFILLPTSIDVQDAPPRMYGISVTFKN